MSGRGDLVVQFFKIHILVNAIRLKTIAELLLTLINLRKHSKKGILQFVYRLGHMRIDVP
jgi:hypothetical protein